MNLIIIKRQLKALFFTDLQVEQIYIIINIAFIINPYELEIIIPLLFTKMPYDIQKKQFNTVKIKIETGNLSNLVL